MTSKSSLVPALGSLYKLQGEAYLRRLCGSIYVGNIPREATLKVRLVGELHRCSRDAQGKYTG
jgi:hypothetical protein